MPGLPTGSIGARELRSLVRWVFIATPLLPLPVHAAATADSFNLHSAADLVELCAVPDKDPMFESAHGFCYGFLSGVGNYHRAVNPPEKGHPLFCLPKGGVTRADAARRFVAWSHAHPQYLSETPVDALMRFAMATWPCARASRQ